MELAIAGVQTAGTGDSVKIASMDATLAGLQMLEAGNFVASEMGLNADALAWYAADAALRMLTGQPAAINPPFPYVRMFTADNIGELTLTPDAERTGEWYGPTDYQEGFAALWGLG